MRNSFGKEIIPVNDAQRLDALHRYRLLDEELPEGYLTYLTHVMAQTFDAPIALISLVDKEKVFFIGNTGMEETREVSRGISLCSLAVLDQEPTVFTNALEEPCLSENPLVTGEFGLRFYAGAPLISKDGYPIGTACVVAKEPREFSDREKELLKGFAQTAMQEIEQRLENLDKSA